MTKASSLQPWQALLFELKEFKERVEELTPYIHSPNFPPTYRSDLLDRVSKLNDALVSLIAPL